MEGVAGVVHTDQASQSGNDYEMMRKAMTLEANAAIEGSIDSGATTVVVNDSHGSMRNLLPYMLDQRAELISGSPKPLGMMQGVESNPDISMCIGYHSRPGEKGILSHTIRGSNVVQNYFINEKPSSEFEINAGIAGYYDVPVGMIAGDTDIVEDAKNLVPNIVGSPVKEAINKFSAKNLKQNGIFVSKIFMGSTFNEIVENGKKNFKEVKVYKPPSSRKDSKESFIICKKIR